MKEKKSCKCCCECENEPECITINIDEVDLVKQFDKVIKGLQEGAELLKKIKDDSVSEQKAEEIGEALIVMTKCKDAAKEFKKVKKEMEENKPLDESYTEPDPNKVERIVESQKLTLEECCDSPEFQKYLDNVNRWAELEDKRISLEIRLDDVKFKQKKVLNKCKAFEDSLDKFDVAEMMKAAIKSMIKKHK